MALLDKIFVTMFALGMLLSFPAMLIGLRTAFICLGIGLLGAICMILNLVWG